MGGKRTSTGRSNSGGRMQPRISSAGSTKSSIIESISTSGPSGRRKRDCSLNINEDDSMMEVYPSTVRKDSFDIISLLEGQGDDAQEVKMLNGEDDNQFYSQMDTRTKDSFPSEEVPSFWRFVQPGPQPETASHEIFHHNHLHHPHQKSDKKKEKHEISNIGHIKVAPTGLPQFPGGNTKLANQKRRAVRRRKPKKAQSAKVASFSALEKSPERLQREGVEWLRVLTPPRSTSEMSACDADADEDDEDEISEEDEIIKRYFSGLSSAGSSISWAEDAMESEFTMQLMKLWEDIEAVCAGGSRPEKMSDAVYEECLQWRKAFPNPDLHRFSSFQNETEISASPTIDIEERSVGDDDAPYSSIVQSTSNFYNSSGQSRKENDDAFDQTMNILQTNFRALNCATPRPNIEKSTEYVSAWLSECQNSYTVPVHLDHGLPDSLVGDKGRSGSPSTSIIAAASISSKATTTANNDPIGSRGRHSLKVISDVARSSYTHYSRSHSKFIADQNNSGSFFPSLAMSHENDDAIASSSYMNDRDRSIMPFYARRTQFTEEFEGEEDRISPIADSFTEIPFRRSNVRVQRPISSRVRDHTITPIATRSAFNPPSTFYGSKHPFNKPGGDAGFSKDFIPGSRSGIGIISEEMPIGESSPPSSAATISRTSNSRIRSGIAVRDTYNSSLTHSYGKTHNPQQQAPWSRHTDEDPENPESSQFASLTMTTSNLGGNKTDPAAAVGFNARTSFPKSSSFRPVTDEFSSSSRSANVFSDFPRSSTSEGLNTIHGCDNVDTFNKPMVSWLMNRRLSPN